MRKREGYWGGEGGGGKGRGTGEVRGGEEKGGVLGREGVGWEKNSGPARMISH